MAFRVDLIWFALHVVVKWRWTTRNVHKGVLAAVQTSSRVLEGFNISQAPRPTQHSLINTLCEMILATELPRLDRATFRVYARSGVSVQICVKVLTCWYQIFTETLKIFSWLHSIEAIERWREASSNLEWGKQPLQY